MKAAVYDKYGPPETVLRVAEVQRPVPKDDEVLLKIYASSVNQTEWGFVKGEPFFTRLIVGLSEPKPKYRIPGYDVAGRVETVGKKVKQFRPGYEVFGVIKFGGLAEYGCVPEGDLVLKPANITFEEAAAVPAAALTALQGIRNAGKVQSGQEVLINGASGGVGTFAVQIAKSMGAEVTAVCSDKNADLMRSIGADHVVDYTKEDFTRNERAYDVIATIRGYYPVSTFKRALRPGGTFVLIGGTGAQMLEALLLGPWVFMTGGKKLRLMGVKPNQADLVALKDLIETGKVRSIIERCYPLSEAGKALQHFGNGHTKGKVVVTIAQD